MKTTISLIIGVVTFFVMYALSNNTISMVFDIPLNFPPNIFCSFVISLVVAGCTAIEYSEYARDKQKNVQQRFQSAQDSTVLTNLLNRIQELESWRKAAHEGIMGNKDNFTKAWELAVETAADVQILRKNLSDTEAQINNELNMIATWAALVDLQIGLDDKRKEEIMNAPANDTCTPQSNWVGELGKHGEVPAPSDAAVAYANAFYADFCKKIHDNKDIIAFQKMPNGSYSYYTQYEADRLKTTIAHCYDNKINFRTISGADRALERISNI